jgi:hypothetical protein
MAVEKEISGASNDASNAPALEAVRASGRQRKATKKLADSQLSTAPKSTLERPRKRQKQSTFRVFEDTITPPSTQPTSQPILPGRQKGQDPSTSQKRHRKVMGKASKLNVKPREQWEELFDAANNAQSKFDVIIETLGHEEFPDYLRIPERKATANLVEELDPLDPLWLWSKFFLPEVLHTIAAHTNENEAIQNDEKDHTQQERSWNDVTSADIGVFIGAAMLMGIQPQACLDDYWNTSEDKPIFPVQQYISRQRFQQISRYLKINNPDDNDNLAGIHDYHKIEPLMSSFRQACQNLINLSESVSVDENLLAARTRSKDLIQIDNKAAGKGYKVYTLCCGSYLYDWIYTSKRAKVPQAKNYIPQSEGFENDAFTDTERMVLTLVEQLLDSHPDGFRFQIAFDNFFTTTRLFTELRAWGVGAWGTAKAGSGMPKPHVFLSQVASKENNYGEIVNTVGRGINFVTFIDQGAVWMMSTVHDVANQPPRSRDIALRPTASTHLALDEAGTQIPYHQISYDYNHKMNGSDVSQQIWNTYPVAKHPRRRNWWPLFWHLVAASIANVLYLYKLQGHKISHYEVQQRLGLQLLRNPASTSRSYPSGITPAFIRPTQVKRPVNEHQWERISRRICVACKPYPRTRGLGQKRRAVLRDIGFNHQSVQPPAKRKRTKQTSWGCLNCQVALCKSSWCWQRHHGEAGQVGEDAQTEGNDDVDYASNID